MRNYQIYPYFLSDGVVLHDTGVGTVPNKQNFASTAKQWALVGTFNKEKALVDAFLVNVNFSRSFVYPSFQALVRSCHHDNHAILTGGSGSGDVSPLPFHLLVNSFSSHIIHSIQILNVSTGPIFLPMVLNAHWKVSKKWRIEGNRGEGFDNNTVLLVGDSCRSLVSRIWCL